MRKLYDSDARAGLRAQGVPEQTIESFMQHYAANRQAWQFFEAFALEAASKGKTLGAKAIMERVRWETEIVKGEEFKINNNWTAYFARVFAMKWPEHAKYFEFRQVEGLKAA